METKRSKDLNEEVPSSPVGINNQLTKMDSLPKVKYSITSNNSKDELHCENEFPSTENANILSVSRLRAVFLTLESKGCLKGREDFSLYLFSKDHR